MAVIDINKVNNRFSKIGNYNAGSRAGNKEHDISRTNLGIYIDDKDYNNMYKESILVENPAANSLESQGQEHLQPYINIFKTVDIAVGSYAGEDSTSWMPSNNTTPFGNWRTYSDIKVHPNVYMQLDTKTISLGFKQDFESLWEKVMKNKIISAIDTAASDARMFANEANPSVMISKYRQVPVLKDISTMTVPSQLKFNFMFGSAGLFSAEEEVVKPILALAKIFVAKKEKDSNFVMGNAPSTEYAFSQVVQSIWGTIKGDANSAATQKTDSSSSADNESDDGGDSALSIQTLAQDVANKLTNLQKAVYDAFDTAAVAVLNGNKEKNIPTYYTTIKFRYGRFVLPWMIVKSVNLDFDFTQVDEYGFPYKGSITLDGLETCTIGVGSMLATTTK